MTTSKFLLVALLSMRSTLGAPTAPLVATRQETSLGPRGFNGEGPATLINAVINYLAPKNAYDPDVPDKCVLSFSQSAGASCQARVQCDQTDALGPYSDPPVWSSCFLHGRQFFTDPNIGDYSINWTQAGGQNGNTEDGLNTPFLQLANVGNWGVIDVEAEANKAQDRDGGNLCVFNTGDMLGGGSDGRSYKCGIPKVGKDGAFGISSDTIVHSSGYRPGWCVMHVTQFQRNENGIGDQFAFDVIMTDADTKAIGQIDKQPVDPMTHSIGMDSNLPAVMIITADGGDDDPIKFAYNGESFDSNDATHCQMGAYDSGSRQGNCGFTC